MSEGSLVAPMSRVLAFALATGSGACLSKPPAIVSLPHSALPTSALLPAPLPRLHDCAALAKIDVAYNDLRASTAIISDRESAKFTPFTEWFADPAHQDDILIWHIDQPVTRSVVYCSQGAPLEYGATFRIHFESRGPDSTFVRVTASEAFVEIPVSANWSRYNRERHAVSSSGFEEYAILRVLAVCAGTTLPQPTFPQPADRAARCGTNSNLGEGLDPK